MELTFPPKDTNETTRKVTETWMKSGFLFKIQVWAFVHCILCTSACVWARARAPLPLRRSEDNLGVGSHLAWCGSWRLSGICGYLQSHRRVFLLKQNLMYPRQALTLYVTEDGLELFLSRTECWDYGSAPPCLIHLMLGLRLGALCMLGTHSTN